MPDKSSTAYINSTDYDTLKDKLKTLKENIDDLVVKMEASRKLRYEDIDIEAERESGRFQPDELYVPLHIIDTNIRREQSPYVQYITQSPRAIILEDQDDSTVDLAPLERDLTKKIRFPGWQLAMFSNIDAFQADGYGVMEVVQELNNPGEVGYENVQGCDFGFISDTRDVQAIEMCARAYYFTRTRLIALCGDGTKPDDWSRVEVDKVITKDPDSSWTSETADVKDKSLYKILKVMFRVNGVVHVAWTAPDVGDNWLRAPRPLFIGRRRLTAPLPTMTPNGLNAPATMPNMAPLSPQMGVPQSPMQQQPQMPPSENDYETDYPYVIFPYLISENNTISQLKGRVFLDQDLQEAASSLLSSVVTKARRSAGLYFSKDVSDPNDDIMMQKNIYFKQGCVINSKVSAFELAAPDPGLFSAIQMLVTANQNETSQVNFAAMNRKDSRKTAEEIKSSNQQQQILSTVQVVLFSIALTQMYRIIVDVVKSRVTAGLIVVAPQLLPLYQRKLTVKPSGDVDVIEKQELIKSMMNTWPVVQQTPMAEVFLMDLLELMFPERIAKYRQALEDSKKQQNNQQNQQMQQMLGFAKEMADGILKLSQNPEWFSDIGRIHAFPVVKLTAEKIDSMRQELQKNGKGQPPQPHSNGQMQLAQ